MNGQNLEGAEPVRETTLADKQAQLDSNEGAKAPVPGTSVDSTSDQRTVNNVMRHQYKVLTDDEKRMMQLIKDKGLEFHNLLDDVQTSTAGSRELSLAKTKIEEAVMWAVKHLTA